MKELISSSHRLVNFDKVLKSVTDKVRDYLISNKIQSLIIGISGGLDSGLNAVILSPICHELGIPLIGRYIHIESNKEKERSRANAIGELFCDDYKEVDLTELYLSSLKVIEEKDTEDKIRRGNIKARLRMIYLYNLSQENKGIVVDNDNMTEHLLGFWTLNGDVGDITPLSSLFKTEVFDLARHVVKTYFPDKERHAREIQALQAVIDAVPTDGLGITSSDVEQFGVESYAEVDDILMTYKYGFGYDDPIKTYLYPKYGQEAVDKVLNRHKRSAFKRSHPKKIKLMIEDIL